jgi:CelD/BcsL family acetyltransferase involved in cellulose biosynthesis
MGVRQKACWCLAPSVGRRTPRRIATRIVDCALGNSSWENNSLESVPTLPKQIQRYLRFGYDPGSERSQMHVTVLKEIPEDSALARDWNRLVERMEHPEVFFTYQWAVAVSRTFHATLTPLLFLMYDGSGLCGVAALATDKKTGATASFLTAHTADYCDIVSTTEARGEVLSSLLQAARNLGVRQLSLSNLRSDSVTWKELPAVSRAQRFHLASRLAAECGLVEFGDEAQRSEMQRAVTHKKRLRNLSKLGALEVRHLVNPDEINRSLAQVSFAQVSRFLATARISPLVRPERRDFFKELAGLLVSQGWLKFSQLEVNGEPVAWNYGFRFADSWFYYLPSFKMNFEHCSPGSCLLRLLIAEGCADPALREMDLGLGDESYKAHFATGVRRTYCVNLSCGLSQHFSMIGRNFVKTGPARFPKTAARLRRVRDLTRSLQRRLRVKGLSATIAHPMRQLVRLIASQEEMLFFEAPATDSLETPNMRLQPVTWENLAEAAMANSDDADTLQYLSDLAMRLKEGKTQGSVLYDPEKQAAHFLSVANAEGFHIGAIGHTITGFESQDIMVFDCWTPARFRGRGYYPLAIRRAAAELQNNERRVWTFCAVTDTVAIRGILKAGFNYRFSLVRKQRLGQSAIVRRDRTYALPVDHSVISKRPDLAVGTGMGA